MCINIRSVCVVFNVILCFLICVICLTIPVHGVAPRLPAPHKGTINPHVVRRRWESCCNRAKTDNLYTCRERSCYYAITTLVKWESSFMHCRHRFSGGPESFINNVKLENEEEELFLRNFIKGLNRYSKGDEKWCTSGIISLDPGSLNSSSPAYDLNSFRWTWDNDSLSDSWLKRKIKDISLPNDKKPEATYALSLVVATGSQKPAKSHQQFCWQKTTDLCVPLCEFRSYGPKNPDDDDVTSITDDTNTTSTTGQTNSYFETTTHEIDNAFNDCCSEARKREDSFCYRSRSCYRLFFNRQNWSEARKTCKEEWFPSVSPEVSARIDLLNFSLTDEISTNYIARKVGSIFIPGKSTDSGYRKIWTDKWICNSIIKGKLQVGDDVTDQNLKDQNLLTGFPSNPQIANGNCFPIMLKIKAQGSTPLTWNGVLEDPSRHHYFLCEFSRNLDGKDGNTTQTPETSTVTGTTLEITTETNPVSNATTIFPSTENPPSPSESLTTPTTEITRVPICPTLRDDGITLFCNNSCFHMLFGSVYQWKSAKKRCRKQCSDLDDFSLDSDLAKFRDKKFLTRIAAKVIDEGLLETNGKRLKFWTGGSVCRNDGVYEFQWNNGDLFDDWLIEEIEAKQKDVKAKIEDDDCRYLAVSIGADSTVEILLEHKKTKHYALCEFQNFRTVVHTSTTFSTETSTTGTTSSLPKSAKCKGKIVTIQMPSGKEILHWPDTRAGDKAFKPCPSGFSGMIEWKCDPDTLEFTPRERPMYQCKNKWIEEFENKMKEDKGSTDVVNIAASLVNKTNEISLSFGEDIKGIVNLVEEMKRNFIEQRKVETKDPNQVKTFAHSVCNTYSNIIRPNQKEAWKYLKEPEQVRESSKILRGVEEVALLASCFAKVKSGIETYITENIAFQTFHFEDTTLGQSIRFPYNESIYNSTSIISLPAELPLENWSKYCENDYTGVGIMYKNLGTYLSSPNEGPKRTQDSGSTFVINSPILAFNFENTTESRKLPANHNVIIVMEHVRKDVKSNQSNCVFWNFTKSMWDTSGCETIEFNKTHTTCQCDHLTNFAVLMDIQGVLPDDENDEDRGHFVRIANIMTYVCCSLSSLFLLMTLIILLSFRILHNRRTTIICNLSLCLLVVHLLVVFALDRTEIPILCSVFAGLLLYALLAAFFWMLLEAYHIYQMLVVVLNRAGNPTRWKIYFCGYGLPLFIVVTAAATERKGFGTPKYCWLSREHGLIWSFAGPVAAIILTNFIIMLMALRNASTAKIKKQQTRRTRALSWIKGTMSLMCLLGITWLVGFFFLNQETIILSFIFIILNGLQGVFIFIFHVALNEKARNQLLHFYKLKATPTISTQTTSIYRYPSTNPLSSHTSRQNLHMSRSNVSSSTSTSSTSSGVEKKPDIQRRQIVT